MGGRPRIPTGGIGEVSVVAWGCDVGSGSSPGVVPRPLSDDGQPGEYPRNWRSGGTYKLPEIDGVAEWKVESWRALVHWRDFDDNLRKIRRWAGSRTRAAESATAAAIAAVENAARERDRVTNAVQQGDMQTTVALLVDQVMMHHVSALAARTQEEYARVRAHMDDDLLPTMLEELPRAVDAGMARAWLEAFVHLHGPSSATRAKALLARALDRAVESNRMRTPVNPIRAVPGAINRKALRRRSSLSQGAPSDDDVAELLARLSTDPLAGLPSGKRRQSPARQAGSRAGNPLDISDIVMVSFLVGLRIGEISALRWRDLTLRPGHGAISVTGTITALRVRRDVAGRRIPGTGTCRQDKTKSPAGLRIVPITDDLVARLLARADELGIDPTGLDDRELPVFPSPGRRATDGKPPADAWRDQGNLMKAIRAAYDRHGWRWASSHTGRRWRATSLLERGFGVRQVGELLGHSSPQTTWLYAKPRGVEAVRAGLSVVASPVGGTDT